jgi:putative transposase
MARKPRELLSGYCYHVTVRCNNREFRLIRDECREVLLFAIQKCKDKFGFKLYALCVMSNHIHYLLEPLQPEDLPKIMHWLNWYTAMCFNQMMNRTGHFWEKRYHSKGFANTDMRQGCALKHRSPTFSLQSQINFDSHTKSRGSQHRHY